MEGFIMANIPFVSDKDQDEMRLTVPASFPRYSLDTATSARLYVHFWDSASKQCGKPKGVRGVEIRWEERASAPAKAEDLSNAAFATRTPHAFAFTEDNQGRRVYFCLRWENNEGEKGPWGAIVSAIVP
jgi:methylase of polypeptide subunit release factors